VSEEEVLPYDRTILSKGVATSDASKLSLRSGEFVKEFDIDFALGQPASKIDRENKQVILKDGSSIPYDKLLLATGGRARVPQIPGVENANVYVLRSASDQAKIKEAAQNAKSIAVIGGGFIASECTANFQKTFKGSK
jgi:NAD(P)H-nitrite reductase large subunit